MSRCCTQHHRTSDRTSQGNHQRYCGYGKKKKKWGDGVEWFQDMDLGEIQELTDTTPEELIEPDLMEMNALKPGPDTEEQDVGETV